MQQHRSNSYLFGGNAPYVEELYEAYLDNPGSVPDNWRTYFDNLQNVPSSDGTLSRDVAHAPVVESFAQRAKANAFAVKASASELAVARKQVHVQSLIAAYRSLGARWADLDPLKRTERPRIPELEPAFYDLTESDMDITFSATNTYFTKAEQQTLREILLALRETYCGTDRRRIHALHRTRREALVAGAAGVDPQQAELQHRAEGRHPRQAHGRRRPRALSAHQVRGPEALLAGGRREFHRQHGRVGAARRSQGRAGDRHRHGAPRPPQRAGEHAGQDAQGPVRRVRTHGRRSPAGRRRQVPPGLLERHLAHPVARCT